MKKRETIVTFTMSIVGILIAGIALLFAWQANKLASEANKIAMLGISSNVSLINTENYSTGLYLYGCQSFPAEYADISYFAQDFFYMTNTGGQSSSLVFVYIPSTKYSWSVAKYDEQDKLIEHPILIQPGETIMLHLVAIAPAKHELLKNIFLPYPGHEYDFTDSVLTWVFELNDGKRVVYSTTPHYWATHGVYFDPDCETAKSLLFTKSSSSK